MKDLKGKRCVILVRSATNDPDQLDQQADSLRQFAAQKHMKVQGLMRVSSPASEKSDPEAMNLLKRKRTADDYDVLLVTSIDRLAQVRPLDAEDHRRRHQRDLQGRPAGRWRA
jgi:DNA invertase Pin-like site-specific DNA recombinase